MQPAESHSPRPSPTGGFRLSALDAAFLVFGAAFAWIAKGFAPDVAIIALLAFGHFFLFCNVFRVRRAYELSWAALFLANLGGWVVLADRVDWRWALGVQLPATTLAIGAEIASPRYHGVGWRAIKRPRA